MPSRFAHPPSSSSLCVFAQRNVTWWKKCQKTNWSDLVQHNGRHNLPPPRRWWERRTRDGVKRDGGRRRRSNRGMAVHLLGGHVAVEGCGHRSDHTHAYTKAEGTHVNARHKQGRAGLQLQLLLRGGGIWTARALPRWDSTNQQICPLIVIEFLVSIMVGNKLWVLVMVLLQELTVVRGSCWTMVTLGGHGWSGAKLPAEKSFGALHISGQLGNRFYNIFSVCCSIAVIAKSRL